MDYKIASTEKFDKEYADTLNYIVNVIKSIAAAKNLNKKYKETIKNLKTIPEAFSKMHTDKMDYRFVNCKNYIIFYSIDDKTIVLHRFLYAKSDVKNRLKSN